MRLFGLIGHPLSHSFSGKYFAEKFEKEGILDCSYENFPIPDIDELKTVLSLPGLQGLNITIPYKEKIIPFLYFKSEIVKKINACNCIKIIDGKLYGFNTDVTGFETSLIRKLNPAIHRHALVLGTGGASNAVKFVLEKLKINYSVVSRKKAVGLLNYEKITPEIIQSNKLIINTTPLGMFPDINDAPPLPYEFLSPDHLLVDLIYNPEKTLFLKKGEEAGAQIQNGLEMLELQAEKSWKIWNSQHESLSGDF